MAVDNSELKKAGLKAGFWNFSTTIIGQLKNFIVSLILARLLTPSDFGLVAMALASIGILESFVDAGFGRAVIQRKEVSIVQLNTVFLVNLIIGVAFTLMIFF